MEEIKRKEQITENYKLLLNNIDTSSDESDEDIIKLDILHSNNIKWKQVGKGKEYISSASGYPPELANLPVTCGEIADKNLIININEETELEINCLQDIYLSNKSNEIILNEEKENILYINSINEIIFVDTDDACEKETEDIVNVPNERIKWWLDVPMKISDKIKLIKMLGDVGANACAANTALAYKNHRQFIKRNKCPTNLLSISK